MIYLVASAERRDIALVRQSSPDLWRRARRYNLPVQLALAAAEEAAASADDIARAALISLAPCQPGSPELYRWGPVAAAGIASGGLADVRLNPTLTLHAVDNLAMSAFAIAHQNHAYCLGLGGAAGQAWCALEAALERLIAGEETEALVMAGDQGSVTSDSVAGGSDNAEAAQAGVGVALLFSKLLKPYRRVGRPLRIVAIERKPAHHSACVIPHAAEGICAFLSALAEHKSGRLDYAVPPCHGDGMDAVTIVVEAL
jgi:hypothetical protein